jgi:hypothetical protein
MDWEQYIAESPDACLKEDQLQDQGGHCNQCLCAKDHLGQEF